MSSPNHPTSNIEDVFSSNFPDYIPASSDYSLASPGNTYSSSSNNSFSLVPIASPTLLLFHDDAYMKVMQAYYAKESLIPPPTIVPPSPMFKPQEFFHSRKLLPTSKQGRDRSSSSTSTLPQAFEIRESSRKTIAGTRPSQKTSTSKAPAHDHRAAIRNTIADSVTTAALEAIACNNTNADKTKRNTEEIEASYSKENVATKDFHKLPTFQFQRNWQPNVPAMGARYGEKLWKLSSGIALEVIEGNVNRLLNLKL
ncbi:hypothetical protein Tco_1027041 [Tanacetum coccineum]